MELGFSEDDLEWFTWTTDDPDGFTIEDDYLVEWGYDKEIIAVLESTARANESRARL